LLKTIDLFCGCGGLSKGFENAGFQILAGFDYWDPAISCYQDNFSHDAIKIDLTDIELSSSLIKKYLPEVIIGGPPCQDFSHAGKRLEGDNANLTVCFARLVSMVKPKWFVMENVDRTQKSKMFSKAREILRNSGYGLNERILDASYCGVPQKRKRFFCIGELGGKDCFLNDIIDSRLSAKPMTLRDYLGNELEVDYYYRHPRNYNRRGIFSIDEPSPTIRGVNRPLPKGYLGHPGDPIEINPNVRALTTLERARVQTFPKSFKWSSLSKTQLEQLIGNAVPVKLAEFVGKCLSLHIKERVTSCQPIRTNS
jgi:DNA (cytosine-5)-methyltransferase 1